MISQTFSSSPFELESGRNGKVVLPEECCCTGKEQKSFSYKLISCHFMLLLSGQNQYESERLRPKFLIVRASMLSTPDASSISDINKLSVGDYVVHNIHGIGVYNGIKTLSLSGVKKDYLEVSYSTTATS